MQYCSDKSAVVSLAHRSTGRPSSAVGFLRPAPASAETCAHSCRPTGHLLHSPAISAPKPRKSRTVLQWLLLAGLWSLVLPASATEYLGTIAGTGTNGSAGNDGFARNAQLAAPMGVAVDAQHNLYIADTNNHRIRKYTAATGWITTIAGTGTPSSTGDGGQASNATVNSPSGLALTSAGLLYIAERGGQRIRCIDLGTGVITTVAGTGVAGYLGDGGAATAARLKEPYGVTVSASGDLYVADTFNHRIRKISAGTITTVAGTGTAGLSGDGAAATAAQLQKPYGVATTSSGDLLIADTGNYRVRQVSSGTITTIAGTTSGFSGDGGAATAAKLSAPRRLLVLGNGDLLVSDHTQSRIRRISAGIITTAYGTGSANFTGDAGPVANASLSGPQEMALDATGAIFVADTNNHRIRMISTGAVIQDLPTVPQDPIFSTDTTCAALAASGAGESTVEYTWSTAGSPPAAVSWSANSSNAAKNTTATFTAAGVYHLAVTMAQGTAPSVTTGRTVTVGQVPTTLTISPTSATLALNATQTFTVGSTGTDQFGQAITTLLPTWSLTGSGTVSQAGLYTALAVPGGPHTVQVSVGPRAATAPVTVINTAPVLSSISASATTVTGTTLNLTANTSDDGGLANLIYTWTHVGTPPAMVYFGNNGVTAAKTTTVTFTGPGTYDFQVEVRDAYDLTATGTISRPVVATLTTVTISPPGTMINPGTDRTFTAAGSDQFSQPLTPAPAWSWTRSGGGNIVASTGVLTASTTPGGPYTVTATGGGKSGNTSFSVGTATPIAHGQSVTAIKDTVLPVTLTASDANLDPLTFTIVTPPSLGTLTGTPPNLSYEPTMGQVGTDQFTFTATDASSSSTPATVQIAILEQVLMADVARSPLVAGDYFDLNRWTSDVMYRTAYLAAAIPGRVWTTAAAGAGVPVITCASQRLAVASAATVNLSVTAVADAPVSFTCFGEGLFTANAQNSITVAANAQGVAQVSFQAPKVGSVPILIASPFCQGRLRVLVQVATPSGLVPVVTQP